MPSCGIPQSPHKPRGEVLRTPGIIPLPRCNPRGSEYLTPGLLPLPWCDPRGSEYLTPGLLPLPRCDVPYDYNTPTSSTVSSRAISSVLNPRAIGRRTPGKATTSYSSETIPSMRTHGCGGGDAGALGLFVSHRTAIRRVFCPVGRCIHVRSPRATSVLVLAGANRSSSISNRGRTVPGASFMPGGARAGWGGDEVTQFLQEPLEHSDAPRLKIQEASTKSRVPPPKAKETRDRHSFPLHDPPAIRRSVKRTQRDNGHIGPPLWKKKACRRHKLDIQRGKNVPPPTRLKLQPGSEGKGTVLCAPRAGRPESAKGAGPYW